MYCNALKLNSSHHPDSFMPHSSRISLVRSKLWLYALPALQITDSHSGWASYYYDNQFCGNRGVSEPSDVGGSCKGLCTNIGKDELSTLLMWGLAQRAGLPGMDCECCDQNYRSGVLTLASPPLSSAHCYPIQASLNPDYNNAMPSNQLQSLSLRLLFI